MALVFQEQYNNDNLVAQVFKYANGNGYCVQYLSEDSTMTEAHFTNEEDAIIAAKIFTSTE